MSIPPMNISAVPQNFLRFVLLAAACGVLGVLCMQSAHAQSKTSSAVKTDSRSEPLTGLKVRYQVSLQSAGWTGWVDDGTSGMIGQGFRVEALQAEVTGFPDWAKGGVWATAYNGGTVWMPWVRDGSTSGVFQQPDATRPLQAVAFRLYNAPGWGVEYRVYVSETGWLEWKHDGQVAGTIGQNRAIEALELRLNPRAADTASLRVTNPPVQYALISSASQPLPPPTKTQGGSTVTTSPQTTQQQGQQQSQQQTITQQTAPINTQQQQSPQQQASQQQTNQPQQGSQQGYSQGYQPGYQQGQQQQGYQQNQQQGYQQGYSQQQYQQGSSGFPPNNSPSSSRNNSANSSTVLVPIATRKVAIVANNGRYLSLVHDARGAMLLANRESVRDAEVFDMDIIGDHRIALKTSAGAYLAIRAGFGSAALLTANSDVITSAEAFELVSAGADRVAFRANAGQHLGVEEFGSFRVYPRSDAPGIWETFVLAKPDGTPLWGGSSAQQSGQQTALQIASSPSSSTTRTITIYDQTGRPIEQNGGAERALAAATNPASPLSSAGSVGGFPRPDAYLSALELEIVEEINFARTRPGDYAVILQDVRRFYNGKNFQPTGKPILKTKEGVKAVDDAIRTLKMSRALPKLDVSYGLSRAARDHAEDTGKRGIIGHTGSDRSNTGERVNRYGMLLGAALAGENCSYGVETARDIVLQMLIDDGVKNRLHRKNLLNPAYKLFGVAVANHKSLRFTCVQSFASDYREK